MSERNEAVVSQFIGAFHNSWPADLDVPLALLADDAVYHVAVPSMPEIRGRSAIKTSMEHMKSRFGDQRHEMKAMGSGGRFVFTERTDYSKHGDGWVEIPLVAVFELGDDGKIIAWREYLDPGAVARQYGTTVEQMNKAIEE